MPKLCVKVGHAEVYATMGQLEEVTAKLIAAQKLQDPRPALGLAAAETAKFVEETHGFLASQLKSEVTSDLRHGALALRSKLLASNYDSSEKKSRMSTLKSLLRLHVC